MDAFIYPKSLAVSYGSAPVRTRSRRNLSIFHFLPNLPIFFRTFLRSSNISSSVKSNFFFLGCSSSGSSSFFFFFSFLGFFSFFFPGFSFPGLDSSLGNSFIRTPRTLADRENTPSSYPMSAPTGMSMISAIIKTIIPMTIKAVKKYHLSVSVSLY